MTGRFKKIEGLDYKQGAVEYPHKLVSSDRYHLHTKPFYNLANKISRWSGDGLDEDTHRHFIDFANIAYALALPAGSRILDVGCGSGWLSEYLARLGYEVTGLDLSPELIRIAEERVSRLPFKVDHETDLNCRFLVHDIEHGPLQETFAAVVCYDSLHHFEDEDTVIKNVAAMLDYGGQFFVAEGERPPAGSESERELREVMEQYETLEAPFSREYLLELLQRNRFAIVGDYVAVTGLVDRDNVAGNSLQFVEKPAFNYLLCKKCGHETSRDRTPDSRNPGLLLARLSLRSEWREKVSAGSNLDLEVTLENTGDTLWLVSRAPLKGRVRLGLKILDESGQTVDESHGWPRLQRAIAPREKVTLRIRGKAPGAVGRYTLKLDLVNQDICWFEQHGSKPLVLPFTVGAG